METSEDAAERALILAQLAKQDRHSFSTTEEQRAFNRAMVNQMHKEVRRLLSIHMFYRHPRGLCFHITFNEPYKLVGNRKFVWDDLQLSLLVAMESALCVFNKDSDYDHLSHFENCVTARKHQTDRTYDHLMTDIKRRASRISGEEAPSASGSVASENEIYYCVASTYGTYDKDACYYLRGSVTPPVVLYYPHR